MSLSLTVAAPAAASAPNACRVTNTDTGKSYTALQPAVDAARRGAHLTIRGTCQGLTVIDRGLVIQGTRADGGRPMLDGNRGVVVLITVLFGTMRPSTMSITFTWVIASAPACARSETVVMMAAETASRPAMARRSRLRRRCP
jgi:hypothetical protein